MHEHAGALARLDQAVGGKLAIASRMTVRLTPKVSVSWLSVGSFWPGGISPASSCLRIAATTRLGKLGLAFDPAGRSRCRHHRTPI